MAPQRLRSRRTISAVQAATTQAVAAIGGIVKRIAEMNMIATAISSAVEEQSAYVESEVSTFLTGVRTA